ncbi:hypothetical protein [Streptomyces sp. NPDC048603]|uniref:hypothetical protein n=1 Tax=Streptomyces sp. NPDC048603 TaxID=3365577 RepID=UPI00371AACB5
MNRTVRAARAAAAAVIPAELLLVLCAASGVRIPQGAVLTAEVLVLCVLGLEAWVLRGLYAAERAGGAGRGAALREAARTVVPVRVRRLLVHELRAAHSLGLWTARRRHGVGAGDHAAPYTSPQTAMMYAFVFVSVVETVALSVLIPWPAVHRVVLVIDVYGVLLMLALHAACVTRPHVVSPDGSLRLRYGALFDLRVPADAITSVWVDRRYPEGRLLRLGEDGVLDLIVGSQTTVTVELNRPLPYVRPLGAHGEATGLRFHADDPGALVAAVRAGREAATAG